MKSFMLPVVVFVCGAVVMMFEIVGARVMGPYVGTSTYVWTSLIGIILFALSLGYAVGGRDADHHPYSHRLGVIIALAAILIALTAVVKDFVSLLIVTMPVLPEGKAMLLSLVLFAPASFLLGMVSPYAVRLRMEDVAHSGATAGNLYALSTFGSIVGTFVAGFFIIPRLGSTTTLSLLSVFLITLVPLLISWKRSSAKMRAFLALLVSLLIGSFFLSDFLTRTVSAFGITDLDTEYNRVWISDGVDADTKRPVRRLATDPYGTQAAMFLDGSPDLVFTYTKFYRLAEAFVPRIDRALTIGGSAYTQPRDFLRRHPQATIDVVEIDPGMTDIARRFFRLVDDPRLSIIHEDGRVFLNETENRYDVIFLDAFNSASNVPFQLTTQETVRYLSDVLTEDGAVLMNVISAIEGDAGKFLRAEYATYASVFPSVALFPVGNAHDGRVVQNILLVAMKHEPVDAENLLSELDEYAQRRWREPIVLDVPVLTDDFAPVESYRRAAL